MHYDNGRESYTFEDPKTTFINKKLSCNSKNVVYVIQSNKCKEIYIKSTQAFNTIISLYKINIKLPKNRKLCVKTPNQMLPWVVK